MRKLFLIVFLSGLYFTSLYAQNTPQCNIAQFKKNIKYLASDELKGRKPGTTGDSLAAHYIANFFSNLGLRNFGGSYLQKFDIVSDIRIENENKLSFNGQVAVLKSDFVPSSLSLNGKFSGNIVFAGYGFESTKDSAIWNDYKTLDVKGKWVLAFKGEPELDENGNRIKTVFDQNDRIEFAKKHGALGLILVSPTDDEKMNNNFVIKGFRRKESNTLPVITISKAFAEKIFALQGENIKNVFEKMKSGKKSVNFNVPQNLDAEINVQPVYLQTHNVVAWLEGADPVLKNEFIIIGGHYDHLGMGGVGSGSRIPDKNGIHNGADDNASGTVGVMEMARQLATQKNELKRSVIFVAFTGEEMGLIGSKYFVSYSPVPLSSIKAMINYDMIGRLSKKTNKLLVTGTGTAKEFEQILRKHNDTTKLKLVFSPDGFGGSDHTSFYSQKIPVLFYNSGMHEDYHKPTDDVKLINFDGVQKILDLSAKVNLEIINRDSMLTYTQVSSTRKGGNSRPFKITLGLMPGFANTDVDGLKVEGVSKDGPAEKSGIQKEDIITGIEGIVIHNINDYMDQLSKLSKGKLIKVDIIRNKEKKTINVQL
jgi:aminopeptidase YwaD